MAEFQIQVSHLARIDIFEIMESRIEFDFDSAVRFFADVRAIAKRLERHPYLFRKVEGNHPHEYRFFPVKGCTAVYRVEESAVIIVRVFGPGRDWQKKI